MRLVAVLLGLELGVVFAFLGSRVLWGLRLGVVTVGSGLLLWLATEISAIPTVSFGLVAFLASMNVVQTIRAPSLPPGAEGERKGL